MCIKGIKCFHPSFDNSHIEVENEGRQVLLWKSMNDYITISANPEVKGPHKACTALVYQNSKKMHDAHASPSVNFYFLLTNLQLKRIVTTGTPVLLAHSGTPMFKRPNQISNEFQL